MDIEIIAKIGFVLFLIMALFVTFMPSLNSTTNETEVTETTIPEQDFKDKVYIWTDTETGVQYIIYRESGLYSGLGGITPRLDENGNLFVEEED